MIIPNNTEKEFDSIQYIHVKASQKNNKRKELPQLDKEHLPKVFN